MYFDADDLAGLVRAIPRATPSERFAHYRLVLDILGVILIAVTGHFGGF